MDKTPQTINFTYANNLVNILKDSGITLLISTYPSGKILIVGEYQGQLDIRFKNFPRPWTCAGTASTFDPETKAVTEVARVPGFTLCLELVGDYAFIGVSKVRESATFSGLPVTRLAKRVCGVWMVNTKTGNIVSHIEFTKGVDEIFSVVVMPHKTTEIADFTSPLLRSNFRVAPTSIAEVKMPETPVEIAAPHFEKGMEYFNTGEKEKAIEAFQKALAIQPDLLPATFNIAIALGDLGRFEEAEATLLRVVENDASIAQTYNSLGYVYFKKGELEKAKKQFETALSIEPDYAHAKNSLALLEDELKKR